MKYETIFNNFHIKKNTSVRLCRMSYMTSNVLLNLLIELRKRDIMRGLFSIYIFFHDFFNKLKYMRMNVRLRLSHDIKRT